MHCGQFTQVTGGSSRLVLYNEECPGQPVRTGYVIPIANESLQTGTSKNQRSVPASAARASRSGACLRPAGRLPWAPVPRTWG